MILNVSRIEYVLLKSDVPGYTLQQETGLSRVTISQLRLGKADIKNLTLAKLEAVQRWIDAGGFAFSYDYSEILSEILSDQLEGLLGDEIYIKRGEYNELLERSPIVDFFYTKEEADTENVVVTKEATADVIDEMERYMP